MSFSCYLDFTWNNNTTVYVWAFHREFSLHLLDFSHLLFVSVLMHKKAFVLWFLFIALFCEPIVQFWNEEIGRTMYGRVGNKENRKIYLSQMELKMLNTHIMDGKFSFHTLSDCGSPSLRRRCAWLLKQFEKTISCKWTQSHVNSSNDWGIGKRMNLNTNWNHPWYSCIEIWRKLNRHSRKKRREFWNKISSDSGVCIPIWFEPMNLT